MIFNSIITFAIIKNSLFKSKNTNEESESKLKKIHYEFRTKFLYLKKRENISKLIRGSNIVVYLFVLLKLCHRNEMLKG
jgi:hypothetical protein